MIENDCDYIATGHYAKIENTQNGCFIKKADYDDKDQTYVLYGLKKENLCKILKLCSLCKHIFRCHIRWTKYKWTI